MASERSGDRRGGRWVGRKEGEWDRSARDGRCCRRRVALRAPRRNFHVEAANRLDAGQLRPCRTADSIFLHSFSPSARLVVPSSLLFPSSKTRFERIIIGGTRAHGLSSREPRSPLFLLIPSLFRASPTALPGRLSYSSLPVR